MKLKDRHPKMVSSGVLRTSGLSGNNLDLESRRVPFTAKGFDVSECSGPAAQLLPDSPLVAGIDEAPENDFADRVPVNVQKIVALSVGSG